MLALFYTVLVAVVLILSTSTTTSFLSALSIAPTFEIDLSKPPSLRWNGAIEKILSIHSWEDSFGPLIDSYNTTLYAYLSNTTRVTLERTVKERYAEHYLELQGLQNSFARNDRPEVTLNYLCFWVWFHELDHANSWGAPEQSSDDQKLFHEIKARKENQNNNNKHRDCTGVLVAPSDSAAPIIHGRNLDQSIHPARNLTLQVQFYYKDRFLYSCTDFYWLSSGLVTCQQNGGVTLEENWRYNHPTLTFEQIMSRIESPATVPQVLMFRLLLSQTISSPSFTPIDFDRAINFFNRSQFAAPWYGIMSGFSKVNNSRSGAIMSISFDRNNNNFAIMNDHTILHHQQQSSSSSTSAADDSTWFMVQTNYDRWKPDPPSDPRRTAAEDTLRMLGREEGATKLGVWQTISTYPVHNPDTFYSVLMTMNETSRGYIRRSMVPSK